MRIVIYQILMLQMVNWKKKPSSCRFSFHLLPICMFLILTNNHPALYTHHTPTSAHTALNMPLKNLSGERVGIITNQGLIEPLI